MELFARVSAALAAHGVSRVFGVPGTQTVPFLESLRRQKIDFTLAAHEGGAAFMAIGHARASGGVGILSTIGGPGFTNALTGVAEAAHDSVPLLHIVNAPPPGDDGLKLQAIDQPAMARPLVKGCFTVFQDTEVEHLVDRALALAMAGEPGPVLLQIAARDQPGDVDAGQPESGGTERRDDREPDWAELASLWRRSQRPALYLGQGARETAARVEELVGRLGVPVLTTPSGRGVLPESHAMAMGFDPLRGHLGTANRLLTRADLIVAIGCKLTHNGSAGFRLELPQERFVHVDPEAANIGAHYTPHLGIVGSARKALDVLLETDRAETAWPGEEVAGYRQTLHEPAEDPKEPRIAGRPPGEFFRWLRGALPPDALVVTDSGQHQIMTRRYYTVLGAGGLLFPSDFQSMGFGVPAATGAKMASTARPVVAVVGDGGLCMSGMEILTAAREGLPIVFAVFSDGKLNQIRLHQLSDFGRAYGSELGALSLDAFSDAVGARHVLYEPDASPELLSKALSVDGPTVLEVPVGDSAALPRMVAARRVKESLRSSVGADRLARLKRFLRKGF